jgi:hypothetical protein
VTHEAIPIGKDKGFYYFVSGIDETQSQQVIEEFRRAGTVVGEKSQDDFYEDAGRSLYEEAVADGKLRDIFYGKHAETLGDVWNAILGDSEKVSPWINETVAKGGKTSPTTVIHDGKEIEAVLMHYPNEGLAKMGVLYAKAQADESWSLYSAFPIFAGIGNSLSISGVHTWGNGIEGVVAASKAGGPPAVFFDPFYFKEMDKFLPGAELKVSLSALAFRIGKAEATELPVHGGEFYETKLKEFLDANPEKSKDDFEPPKLKFQGSRILMPTQYVCEWFFRCPVSDCVQFSFLNTIFYRLTVIFAGVDDSEMSGYIYASEHVLKDYVPQAGDDVEGILWMTGWLA